MSATLQLFEHEDILFRGGVVFRLRKEDRVSLSKPRHSPHHPHAHASKSHKEAHELCLSARKLSRCPETLPKEAEHHANAQESQQAHAQGSEIRHDSRRRSLNYNANDSHSTEPGFATSNQRDSRPKELATGLCVDSSNCARSSVC